MIAEDLPTSHLFLRKDARKIDDTAVRGLVASINEIGILNPLRVRPVRRHVAGVEADAWEVTAGAHRLKAALRIGLSAVPCIVSTDDDLRAELAMIDENLCRAELSPADRASNTARRKAIYLELHPETARSANIGPQRQFVAAECPSFAEATADAIGKDQRTIQRDAERGEKISERALAMVRGTSLDKGTELDKLKKVDADKQEEWVKRRLDFEAKEREAKEREAKRPRVKDSEDVEEDQRRSLLNAWNRANESVRQWFRDEILDAPVFDRGAA